MLSFIKKEGKGRKKQKKNGCSLFSERTRGSKIKIIEQETEKSVVFVKKVLKKRKKRAEKRNKED